MDVMTWILAAIAVSDQDLWSVMWLLIGSWIFGTAWIATLVWLLWRTRRAAADAGPVRLPDTDWVVVLLPPRGDAVELAENRYIGVRSFAQPGMRTEQGAYLLACAALLGLLRDECSVPEVCDAAAEMLTKIGCTSHSAGRVDPPADKG